LQPFRRLVAGGLAAVLVFGLGQPGWAAPAGQRPGNTAAESAQTDRRPVTVTLLTGDRVTLSPGGGAAVRPAKDRQDIRFVTQRVRGDLHVIPQDALPLIRSGTLDRRLFNITGLVSYGYHDEARDSLPLIVSYGTGADAARRAPTTLSADGVRVGRELPAISGAAVSADKADTARFWAGLTAGAPAARTLSTGGMTRIWLDAKRPVLLDHSVPQIGAPTAHEAGFTGAGVTVAVLDTGIDGDHPDLVGKVADARNFSEEPESADTVGHGTHVAGIIAGSGEASGGTYRGVAPDATLISGKVCESYWCTESAMLAGMHWAAAEKRATVVNFSIGGGDSPEIDPLEEAVNTLTEQTGTLFVISAGNAGDDRSVGSPGSADAALTVGAVDRDDQLADFSSRGPRVGDDAIKPDITAPGVEIVAARASGTTLGEPVGDSYVAASGTSMSAPHVTGAVAVLAQRQPAWVADQFKATLMASATPRPELTAYQQGAGRVDVARAIGQSVTSDPASVSYGRTQWPHHDDEAITKTVTYRNDGSADITLDLALRTSGPDGAAAPGGMFQVAVEQATIPAGGRTEVEVTVDTSVDSPGGYYGGHLVATSGETRVVTPIAVHKEIESYDLTLVHTDQDGVPAADYWTLVLGLDDYSDAMPYDSDGGVTVRLPTGRYGISSVINTPRDEAEFDSAVLVHPDFTLAEDATVTFDARKAKPVRATVPDESAQTALVDLSFAYKTDFGGLGVGVVYSSFDGIASAQLGGRVPADQFVSALAHQWAQPDGEGWFANSPYLYAITEVFPGRLPTGYRRDYRHRDLGTVRNGFRGVPTGTMSERAVFPVLDDPALAPWVPILPVETPGVRIEYHSTQKVRWAPALVFGSLNEEGWMELTSYLWAEPRRYQPGRNYRDTWNMAPFGPVFPPTDFPEGWVSRQGDLIRAEVPLFGDADGHAGYSSTETARTALYRDGKLVDEWEEAGFGSFEVPPGRANYRLETSATRDVSDVTTAVSATWTFQSGRVTGDRWAPLPVMAVGFTPKVDAVGAAPAGRRFDIPVSVLRQSGTAVDLRKLTVEVSYDDGATWQPAGVRAQKTGWVATVRHPDGDGYVSLRAKAVDKTGNTVTQTITHAYRLTTR